MEVSGTAARKVQKIVDFILQTRAEPGCGAPWRPGKSSEGSAACGRAPCSSASKVSDDNPNDNCPAPRPHSCGVQAMVELTITKAIYSALRYCSDQDVHGWPLETVEGDYPLTDPQVGQPISHTQVIALSRTLRDHVEGQGAMPGDGTVKCHLDDLLRGSTIYVEPPKQRAEPVGPPAH